MIPAVATVVVKQTFLGLVKSTVISPKFAAGFVVAAACAKPIAKIQDGIAHFVSGVVSGIFHKREKQPEQSEQIKTGTDA